MAEVSLEDVGRVRHSRVSSGTIWRVGELHLGVQALIDYNHEKFSRKV